MAWVAGEGVELSVEPENERAVHPSKKRRFVVERCGREHHYDDGCYRNELIMAVLVRELEAVDHSGTP